MRDRELKLKLLLKDMGIGALLALIVVVIAGVVGGLFCAVTLLTMRLLGC